MGLSGSFWGNKLCKEKKTKLLPKLHSNEMICEIGDNLHKINVKCIYLI